MHRLYPTPLIRFSAAAILCGQFAARAIAQHEEQSAAVQVLAVSRTISFQPESQTDSGEDTSPEITTRTGISREGDSLEVGDVGLTVFGGGGYTFAADFKGVDGDVALTRAGGAVDISFRPTENLSLVFGVDLELTFTEFSDAADVLPGLNEPFDDLYRTGVRGRASLALTDLWSLTFGAGVEWALEDGADADDAITGGGFVAAGYRVSESFSMQFGASVLARFDDDALVVPFIGFRWQLTDDTSLRSNGLKLEFSHFLSDQIELFATAGAEFRQYRLAEDRARTPGGSLSDIRIPVGGGIRFQPTADIQISLEGGVIAWQEYGFLTDNGVKISDVETDPSPYLAAFVRIEF